MSTPTPKNFDISVCNSGEKKVFPGGDFLLFFSPDQNGWPAIRRDLKKKGRDFEISPFLFFAAPLLFYLFCVLFLLNLYSYSFSP